LQAGIPVYHAPGDAGAATLGAGCGIEGRVYAYLGTSGWVAFSSPERVSPESGVFTLAHPDPSKFIYIAPLLTAGGNLDWVRSMLAAESHAEMIEAALEREPSSLLYLPYLNGERSPFSDPTARGAFIGLNPRHTRDDLSRAVLEGIIYAYRHNLDTLIKEPVAALTLTGGGTRSARWCQLFADITQTPVQIADDASNVGLRGALVAAQVASGQRDTYAPENFFPLSAVMQPDEAKQAHYDKQYALFRQAYPALKPIFAEMQ
jgi:xylulokinase